MAITAVQNTNKSSNGSASVIVHPTTNTVAGNFLTAQVCLPANASVSSITDNTGNRWIQQAYSYNTNGGAEIWSARGIQGGSASVTLNFTAAGSVGVNIAEWAGVWWVDPTDCWSQNFGTSASPIAQTLQPRTNGDLFIGVCSAGASVSAPITYTNLAVAGNSGYSAGYSIAAGSVSSTAKWSATGTPTWAVAEAAFVSGASGVNPNLQFPETLVEISTTTNYQAPLMGQGIWTNITSDVRSMTLGPLGRQHELDRVQATPSTITVNNRNGNYNTWNTTSFLYNGGAGLKPMNPVKVAAAWSGVTYPQYYGYFQSVTPVINDVLDVDATIQCIDIFQLFSLKYLSNNNYAQQVLSDGGASVTAYYRLGDAANQSSVKNAASVSAPGSLIAGPGGSPAFGTAGVFLFDADTALDLTNGTNVANGGFTTNNNLTSPPSTFNPVSGGPFTFECWEKWLGGTNIPSPSASVGNVVLYQYTDNSSNVTQLQIGYSTSSGTFPVTSFSQIFLVNPSGNWAANGTGIDPLDGNWHHIVLAGNNLYLDGQLLAALSAVTAGATSLTVGTPNGTSYCSGAPGATTTNIATAFNGVLDEVAIYNTILNSTQVLNHYNIGLWLKNIEIGAASGGTSAGRLNKILTIAGLPTSILNVPYAFNTQLYGETNPITTTSALNYIQTQTETEPGLIFQGPNGQIYAYSRQYQYLNPTSVTSQGTFGDSSGAAYHYDGTQLQIVQDDLDVFNDIQVQSSRTGSVLQEWGPVQSSTAATSASVYGPRTMQGLTSLQFEYDSDALAVSQGYSAWYTNPLARVQQIVTHSYTNGGNNLPQMLGRGLLDRVTVQYQGQAPGPQFSQDSLIESISHTIVMDAGPSWTTNWQLSPYEVLLLPWIFGQTGQDAFGGPQLLTL